MIQQKQITLGSLFDGIGGFPYAALFYGIRPVWASEILPDCVSVTKRHFPTMAHVGDITKLDGRKLDPVDIITFGSPCQGLSIAGQRLGLADERSGLFSEAIRIIREMQEVTNGRYPQIAVWENVPGALSSAKGRDFKAVLEAFTKTDIPMPCSGRWTKSGMVRSGSVNLAWCVYDAQYFGTAQRRRRVFLVADFRGKCAEEILFIPKSLYGYFAAGGTPRQGIAAYAQNRIGAAGVGIDGYNGQITGGLAATLGVNCGMSTGRNGVLQFYPAIEILNDQGGSSISVESGGISPTLRSETHGNLPIVAAAVKATPPIGYKNEQAYLACGFDLQQITSKANRTTMKPIQPTLCAAGAPHVVTHPQIAGTLCASGAGLSRPAGMASETDLCIVTARTPPVNDYLVRRLTPVECERLQGYPDGWTAQGYDGQPISDTKRYQMLGNSVAVPCVAYIMQGIFTALQRRCD